MNATLPSRCLLIVLGAWLASTSDAAAYVDPGSTSYLFQILIGALTAVAFFFGSIKRRVAGAVRWVLRRPAPPVPPPAAREPVISHDAVVSRDS